MNPVPLKRSLSKLLITFYGLGTILGAGIYVLVGKVATHAGIYTPLAFLLASSIALFTAVSYAELSSRFPKSAGEAFYVQKAFQKQWLSAFIGWLVVFTGLVSAAAITRGFVGYFQLFIDVPSWVAIVFLVVFMGIIAIWGIKESAMMVMLITLIEVGGLVIIIFLASDSWHRLPGLWHAAPSMSTLEWTGIFSGAFLAFYAYIGFEDMVNVAEEIKNPEKNLPPAIFWALGIATLLYLLVALAMILALPMDELAKSDAPLATFIAAKGFSPNLIALISLVAIINGALVQVIMASRVIYGMANQQNAPQCLATVHPRTQTPVVATLLVVTIILILALWFNIEALAKLTSTIILCVFMMIHLALIRIKWQKKVSRNAVSYSVFFPIAGFVLSTGFLFGQLLF
ncbi:APC family permease [Legionella nagasakiensis]|uniref:APC family permease n=1 Tax=Legionella nagasakiensis TaxID=535290 RepID=UPI0010552F5D|nr:amino acid permease [Legionella nagasakiensis]